MDIFIEASVSPLSTPMAAGKIARLSADTVYRSVLSTGYYNGIVQQ